MESIKENKRNRRKNREKKERTRERKQRERREKAESFKSLGSERIKKREKFQRTFHIRSFALLLSGRNIILEPQNLRLQNQQNEMKKEKLLKRLLNEMCMTKEQTLCKTLVPNQVRNSPKREKRKKQKLSRRKKVRIRRDRKKERKQDEQNRHCN